MFYKTEDLLDSIKVRTLMPSSQQTFSDTDLIKLANEELQGSLVPDIISIREHFFAHAKTTSIVARVNHYVIPERAIGNALKDVVYIDTNNDEFPIPYGSQKDNRNSTGSRPQTFVMRGDEVVLLPIPDTSSGSIKLRYAQRPNQLVATTSVGKLTVISNVGGTTTFTLDTDISASLTVGGKIDILSVTSPFKLWAQDVVVTAVTGTSVSVSTASISNEASVVLPQLGDYLCVAQQANIPQVPQEFHPILAQMVAARVMEALGDVQKLQSINAKLMEMRRQAFQMIANRVELESEHISGRRGLLNYVGRRWSI